VVRLYGTPAREPVLPEPMSVNAILARGAIPTHHDSTPASHAHRQCQPTTCAGNASLHKAAHVEAQDWAVMQKVMEHKTAADLTIVERADGASGAVGAVAIAVDEVLQCSVHGHLAVHCAVIQLMACITLQCQHAVS
jgi:hypothetical protein